MLGRQQRTASRAIVAQPPAEFFDVDAQELVVNEQRVPLRPLEFNVLRYLSERASKAVPRGDLLKDVWDYS